MPRVSELSSGLLHISRLGDPECRVLRSVPRSVVVLCALMLVVPLAVLPGCASSPPQSTRLTTDDLQTVTIEMAERLRGSDFLRDRTADSPRIIVAIQKVENLSMDIITEGERWYLLERVVGSNPIMSLRQSRNIGFVIPAERVQKTREVTGDSEFARGRAPTHEMTATFRSVTRAAGLDRTDLYACEYRVTELASGKIAWTDVFEFKRAAAGKAYD
jgi:hypothetical protein